MRLLRPALRLLGLALYGSGLARMAIWLGRRAPTVLVYHACAPDDLPFLPSRHLAITPEAFARQLEFLQRYYRVVDLATIESGNFPERAVAVTFDDGMRSVRTRLLAELERRRIPVRVYLVTDVLDNAGLIWMHELVWVLRTYPAVARPSAASMLGIEKSAEIETFLACARDRASASDVQALLVELRGAIGYRPEDLARNAQLYLTRDDLTTMAGAGATFGNHTASHQDMTRLDEDTCAREIAAAQAQLATVPGSRHSLAYPFGRRNEAVRRLALSLGVKTLAKVGGSNSAFDHTCISRVGVAHESVAELFAQMVVVEPAKAWLIRMGHRLRGHAK
jgi:peptidoglycan/xylan/chitin deacetylase (PgdA/CDA1 family)